MVDTIKFYIETEEEGVRAAMREAHFASLNETEARQS